MDGGSLRYRAPAGTLSDELRSQIRSQRTELIDWLSSVIVPTENVPDADDLGADLPFTPNQIWYLRTVRPQDVDWSNIVSWQFRTPVSAASEAGSVRAGFTTRSIPPATLSSTRWTLGI